MFRWIKKKLISLWNWFAKYILDPQMVVWLIIAEIVFWSPSILGAIFGLTVNPMFWTIAVAYIAIWFGPFTPAIPLQIALALALKRTFYVEKNLSWAIGKWNKSKHLSERTKKRIRDHYKFVGYKIKKPLTLSDKKTKPVSTE